jgi:hypothetical protein
VIPSGAVRFTVILAIGLWTVTSVAEPAARAEQRERRGRTGKSARSSKEDSTPWSVGVSKEDQKRALFEEAKYTDAVAKYEEALIAWDHPNIRFNMAVCLINMRQPLVAWNHLQKAVRFGEGPLGKRLFAEATRTVSVLEASLADLTIQSSQPDVRVLVDGAEVLVGPGNHTMKLLAGKHQLVASRRGYVTDSHVLDLPPGEPVTHRISLVAEEVKVVRENYERRWAWWVPWSVAGTSVALGLAGAGFYLTARSDIREYDRELIELCPFGCTDEEIPESLKQQERSARHNSRVAVGIWTAAGALAVTGGVMAILNRPRRREVRTTQPLVTVTPTYVGVGLSFGID